MNDDLQLIRTDSDNKDFRKLVKALDAFLAITDGDEHEFYDQFNKPETMKLVVVLYIGEEAVACGALKEFDQGIAEIKRMFTRDDYRGRHLAEKILRELEIWATESGYSRCILETGIRQKAAISLYERCGYQCRPCYGQYTHMPNSRCFEKNLPPGRSE